MTKAELADIIESIRSGGTESTELELKSQWWDLKNNESLKQFIKDVSGLANAKLGEMTRRIVVGLDEQGQLKNAPLPLDEAALQAKLGSIEPLPSAQFFQFNIEGFLISGIELSPPFNPPYVAKTGDAYFIWVRRGSRVTTATRRDLDYFYSSKQAQPKLDLEWALWTYRPEKGRTEVPAPMLPIKTLPDISITDVEGNIQKDIQQTKEIWKGVDRRAWQLSSYLEDTEKFLKKLKNQKTFHLWRVKRYSPLWTWFELTIKNHGDAPAKEVRVEIDFPTGVEVFSNIPDKYDVPSYPKPPTPPAPSDLLSAFGKSSYTPPLPPSFFPQVPKSVSGWAEGRTLRIRADRILHTYSATTDEGFKIVALPNVPLGIQKIKARCFHVDLKERFEVDLEISIEPVHEVKLGKADLGEEDLE